MEASIKVGGDFDDHLAFLQMSAGATLSKDVGGCIVRHSQLCVQAAKAFLPDLSLQLRRLLLKDAAAAST